MSGRLLPVIPAFRRMEGRIAEGQGKFQASLLNILSVAQSSKSRERALTNSVWCPSAPGFEHKTS